MKPSDIQNQYFKNFLLDLGKLLSIRFNHYFQNNGGEIKFFNKFIICPPPDCYDNDFIRYPAFAKSHFDKNIKINIISVELNSLSLNKNKEISYHLSLFISILNDDYYHFQAELINDTIVEFIAEDEEELIALEKLDNDMWLKINKKLHEEISFGTLALS
jgi:hypothetical protein